MSHIIDLDIPKTWKFVRTIKASVEQALADFPKELRYAAGMAASELVGNAIKYGELPPPPHLTCSVDDKQIVIEVSNRVASEASALDAQRRIEQANAGHGEELFLGRLQELLTGAGQGGQLGLYRICYEGAFDLSCCYADQVLTITATRGLTHD